MIYNVFKNERLVASGSLEEVSKKTGYAPNTIKTFVSKPYHGKKDRWEAKTIRTKLKPIKVDLEFLRKKIKEYNYKYEELAQLMEVHTSTVSNKMNGVKRFTNNDIEFFEDLFFLEKGELILKE